MDSKPEYDEWYVPMDPFGILIIGVATIFAVGILTAIAHAFVTEPKGLIPIFTLSAFAVVCYGVGLAVYHGYQRFV